MLKAMFNGGEEGKAWMEGGGHDNGVARYSHDTQRRQSDPLPSIR